MIKIKKKTKAILPVQYPMELYQLVRKVSFEKNVRMAELVRIAVRDYIGY
jgi:hypothetical protein